MPRDLGVVIDQMLEHIPQQEHEFLHDLKKCRESFNWTSPETIPLRWISVEEKIPEEGIRVWGSTGFHDVGQDVYIGQKPALLIESFKNGFHDFGEVCWRYTQTSEEIKGRPIKYWMPLPEPPEKAPVDPTGVCK